MMDPISGQSLTYEVSNLSILVIDDHEFTRKLLMNVLNALHIRRIHMASDGAEGYQMFCDTAIDMVIVDWEMQPVNGPQFVKRVRTDESSANPYVPIMMISANTEMSSVMKARDFGVNEFLAKPISPAKVYERMVRILESTRPYVKTPDFFGPDRRRRKDPNYRGPERRKDHHISILVTIRPCRDRSSANAVATQKQH